MKYRAEIDGLRALAVVPVILFHAGFELFSGGFVGVDVFFVISGYLITTILIEDIENQRFSLVNFYERRARRILPALFFVMLVCIPFAWMWMLPNQMKDFSQSLVAVSLFASNVLFWRESGYFDAAAEEKPLLHTWSLAVEEQYYVLFPIFLFLAWRYGKNRVFWMIVAMASISLLLSEWGWRNKATANFYLAPTRAWELFAGSIAAFIVQKQGVQKNNFLALLGLAAIIFSIFFYDEATPFPSVYALVPVLGVVLLVLYADKETLAAKLLSTKGFVGVGLISYSAYLWHQPLFAFARIRPGGDIFMLIKYVITIGTFGFAYLSWKYVEKPFRNNQRISRTNLLTVSVISFSTILILGLIGHQNNGFPNRFPISKGVSEVFANQNNDYRREFKYVCHDKFYKLANNEDPTCKYNFSTDSTGTPDLLVWGDSHVNAFSDAFIGAAQKLQLNVWVASLGTCPPSIGIEQPAVNQPLKCSHFNEKMLELVELHLPKIVIFSSRWENYINKKNVLDSGSEDRFIKCDHVGKSSRKEIAKECLSRSFSSILNYGAFADSQTKLLVMAQAPMLSIRPSQELLRTPPNDPSFTFNFEDYKKKREDIQNMLNGNKQVIFVETWSAICGENKSNCSSITKDHHSLMLDHNHVSAEAARRAIPWLTTVLNAVIN